MSRLYLSTFILYNIKYTINIDIRYYTAYMAKPRTIQINSLSSLVVSRGSTLICLSYGGERSQLLWYYTRVETGNKGVFYDTDTYGGNETRWADI